MRIALVGKRSTMAAESAVKTMSLYYKSLDSVAKKRYIEKLTFSKGTESLPDPYSLLNGWSESPSGWPDITFGDIYIYLIHTPGSFTNEELKAYKSLDAYK